MHDVRHLKRNPTIETKHIAKVQQTLPGVTRAQSIDANVGRGIDNTNKTKEKAILPPSGNRVSSSPTIVACRFSTSLTDTQNLQL